MTISPNELDAILQKVRAAFLQEDAPGYIEALRTGIQPSHQNADFFSLLSTLHSLKGGAGVAQFYGLYTLAHQLEDLIQSLQTQSCMEPELAWNLFGRAIEEIENTFKLNKDLAISPELLETLEKFVQAPSKSGKKSVRFRFDLSDTITYSAQLGKYIWKTAQKAVNKLNRAAHFNNGETHSPPSDIGAEALTEHLVQAQEGSPVQPNQPSTTENYDKASAPAREQSGAAPPKLGKFLRLPLEQLDQMLEATEELISFNERQNFQQQQLEQANLRLEVLLPQFQLLQSRLKEFYDNLTSTPTIQLNSFNPLPESLNTVEELVALLSESFSVIDLTTRNLAETQKESRRHLEKLYTSLIRSRLVPFKRLAQGFLTHIIRLNQRYRKEVKLIVRGGELLVDQSILEELRSPFNHLINNAFDHGIEPKEERVAQQKPQIAEIVLQATAQENELIFSVSDDGRGIEPHKIYRHALQRGLTSQTPMSELSQEEILSFLFQPGFSTASNTNDLSGRGMGLDIVEKQVSSLRGTLQIESIVGQGTTFIIKLPPSLSFLPLLLCRIQKRIVAIPVTSVLQIISYSELEWISVNPPFAHWKQSNIPVPVVYLSTLLKYSDSPFDTSTLPAGVGSVVLAGPQSPLIAIVDAIIGQQKLIVKPLNHAVTRPHYLAGCTILASGEVVPVLLPQKFDCLQQSLSSSNSREVINSSTPHQKNQTILLAEDSQATRILIKGLLEEEGFHVICSHDGQEAIDEFLRHSEEIDLVISDIEMPRIDGFAFLRQIRQESDSTLPVIILSSRTTENYHHQAMDLGANAFVSKQSLSELLVLTVKKLLIHAPLTYN